MMQLRPYQQQAVDAVYDYLRQHDDNPCVVLPVGAGKSLVLATICKDAVTRWHGRVLILAHVKELLEQTADKLQAIAPDVPFGVYSAGLKRRDTEHAAIVAGIQSVYRRACELDAFDLVIIDECHLIPAEGEGMYRQFITETKLVNPAVRIIGLTATPFRLKSGLICGPENILNAICFEVGLRELIRDGYLSPLVSKAAVARCDTGNLHIRGGEFVAEEVEALVDTDELVEAACAEIVQYTADRQAVLIFAAGVRHAEHVQHVLTKQFGCDCGLVTGTTPAAERELTLRRFRGEDDVAPLKFLSNCAILTTGVDVPRLDAIAILRPTMSPGLLVQMIGRGTRLFPGKRDCLVLDFGGNLLRHGPIDQIRVAGTSENGGGDPPAKECPACHAVVAAGYAVCPQCGEPFPKPERASHEPTASREGVLSGEVTSEHLVVRDVFYAVHTKRGADDAAPKSLRVDYRVGFNQYKSEWVCFEHQGYARWKAEQWWQARSNDPVPDTAQQAVDIANAGGLALTKAITVRRIAGDPYERIIEYELGEKPEGVAESESLFSPDEIPF